MGFIYIFGDDVAIGEPGLSRDSVELIEDSVLSSLVRVDSELAVVEEFTLKVSKIHVERFGRPQFMQHHEMSLEPRILYIFWETPRQSIWKQRWQWSLASPSSSKVTCF